MMLALDRLVIGAPAPFTSRHLIGITCPALTRLRTELSIGCAKPTKTAVSAVVLAPDGIEAVVPPTVSDRELPAGPTFATVNDPPPVSVTSAAQPAGTETTVVPPPRTTLAAPVATLSEMLWQVIVVVVPASSRTVNPHTVSCTCGPAGAGDPLGAGVVDGAGDALDPGLPTVAAIHSEPGLSTVLHRR